MERERNKKLNSSRSNDSYVENNNNRLINLLNKKYETEEKKFGSIYAKNILIYGWGKNKYGELGIGHNTNINTPYPLKSFKNQLIKFISSGGKHSAILLENGSLYLCGTDVLNLLGTDNIKWKEQHKFLKMTLLENENFTQIACAEFHTLCLNEKGEVFTWGGAHSKLGQSHFNSNQKPFLINSLLSKKIIEISCGDHHSAALSKDGELYTWGGGGQYNRGQCGHGDLKENDFPRKIEFFSKTKRIPKRVVCGGYHTMVLCDTNELFGFGKGQYGQLGYGGCEDSLLPRLVKFNKIYETFEKEYSHLENSNLFMLENLMELNTSIKINATNTNNIIIKDIKCGGDHTLVLSSSGKLYTFGHGYTGQLGLGNSKNYHAPMLVKSLIKKQIIAISAGWSHSMILSKQNFIYVSGCGKYGELGLEDEENRFNFTLVRSTMDINIKKIFSGGHHSWIVADSQNPERVEINSPSPIKSGNESPNGKLRSPKNNDNTMNNTKNIAKFQNSINEKNRDREQKLKFDLDLLAGKFVNRERFALQVAYTDLKIFHRFIRFSISPNSRFKEISYKDLNNNIGNFFKNEKGLISFRLQDDSDINIIGNFKSNSSNLNSNSNNKALDLMGKEIKNNYRLNLNKKNFYSIVMIYDFTKNSEFMALKENIEDIKLRENISSYSNNRKNVNDDIISISEDDIRKSEIEKTLSSWVLEFQEHFKDLLEGDGEVNEDYPKYLELRPHSFYIS